ncbi:MAG: hypothetical protein LW817_04765 [Candidatus Caenarcaniphilales bacterium]|jgi:hypothetical protein|nr:hypothetical protein [Candidatus Caenarcaniphilales bacterium]
MGLKPIAYAACGAIAGPKLKVTVTRYQPSRPEEVIAEQDYRDTSALHMARVMDGLVSSYLIPQQKKANSHTSINTKPAIIVGWSPETFFTDLDSAIRQYHPSDQVADKFGMEQDRGCVQQAVYNAFQRSGMKFQDYFSACRVVAANPLRQDLADQEIDQRWSQWITGHMKNYSNGGEQGKLSLKQLEAFMYDHGKTAVESLRNLAIERNDIEAFWRMSEFDPDDPTKGNRFSSFGFAKYGKAAKALIRLPGMRKALADGIRDELGFPRDEKRNHTHVLCPKVKNKDSIDRPLTNVAGAILNQVFIREGHMTIDDLHAPYA